MGEKVNEYAKITLISINAFYLILENPKKPGIWSKQNHNSDI